MEIPFQKFQGLGNDFIIFFEEDIKTLDYPSLAQKVCNRNFGLGSDGMMVLRNTNPLEMLFFNQDGSIAPMCGNGIRCFARYAYEQGFINTLKFSVQTLGGLMKVELDLDDDFLVNVNLGKPSFKSIDIPSTYEKDQMIDEVISIDNLNFNISSVFIGTSHSVLFVDDFNDIDIDKIGKSIENHSLFPQKINVNFCKIISENEIDIITWERGVGRTLACGTGACASVLIANRLGYTKESVKVNLLGGKLFINIKDQDVYMKGNASLIAKGFYYL